MVSADHHMNLKPQPGHLIKVNKGRQVEKIARITYFQTNSSRIGKHIYVDMQLDLLSQLADRKLISTEIHLLI